MLHFRLGRSRAAALSFGLFKLSLACFVGVFGSHFGRHDLVDNRLNFHSSFLVLLLQSVERLHRVLTQLLGVRVGCRLRVLIWRHFRGDEVHLKLVLSLLWCNLASTLHNSALVVEHLGNDTEVET